MAVVIRRGEGKRGGGQGRRGPVVVIVVGGALVAVLAVLLSLRALFYFVPPEVAEQARKEATPPPPHAATAEEEVARKVEALRSPEGPGEVEITEAELNALLGARLPKALVRAPKARLKGGSIEVSALVNHKGRWLFVEAEGRLALEGRRAVRFVPESVKVGRAPLPRFVARRIEERLGGLRVELPFEVDELRVEEGRVVLVKRGG